MDTAGVRITKVERHGGERPYYTANASVNGDTRSFHNRFGSWVTERRPRADSNWPKPTAMREAPVPIATALQAHLPRAERGRR